MGEFPTDQVPTTNVMGSFLGLPPTDNEVFKNKRSLGIILSSKYVRSNAIQLPRALARG